MRQQINLYQPIFSEERKPFSAAMAAALLGMIITALLAFSVYANWNVGKLAREVDALREQQAQQEALLAQAGEANTARDSPAEIAARIKTLTTAVSERGRALELLQSGGAGQTIGFVSRLEALARRHVKGLWIDNLALSGTNGSMSLSGATLNPDIVPTYLHSLAQEPILAGTRFDEFFIERPAETEVPDASAEDDLKPKKQAPGTHIRFRAGAKALAPTVESAT
jgi:cell division protein FtsB